MGNLGIKVMKATKDITSTDPLDHVMSSSYGAVKIVQETLGTIVLSGTGDTKGTVTHNLGFAPMVLVYSEVSANKWSFGFPYATAETMMLSADTSKTYVGTANLVLNYNKNSAGTANLRYKVYIMGDSG